MSSRAGSAEARAALVEAFLREVKQLNGLAASFQRAAAARAEVNVTDLEVIDLLELGGPMTAGQLAELMGLTTGAITGMIDRMEKAGFLRRDRDPQDGRRVIVTLASDATPLKKLASVLDGLRGRSEEIVAKHSDAQLTFLVDFLKERNAMSRLEVARLRAPSTQDFTAPLAGVKHATLHINADAADVFVAVGTRERSLCQATFEGAQPKVSVEGGAVSIGFPKQLRQLLGPALGAKLGLERRVARVQLSKAVAWEVSIRGAGSSLNIDLAGATVKRIEVEGAGSLLRVVLPKPSGVVTAKFSGGGSDISILRPAGVAVRAQLKGWGSGVAFDDEPMGEVGSGMRLNTPEHATARDVYEVDVSGSGSMVKIGQS